jgi:hypothetical protein
MPLECSAPRKLSDIERYCLPHPETGELVRLYNPRKDRWEGHFRIIGPVVEPLTGIGATRAQLLRLNVTDPVVERQLLQSLNRYPKV